MRAAWDEPESKRQKLGDNPFEVQEHSGYRNYNNKGYNNKGYNNKGYNNRGKGKGGGGGKTMRSNPGNASNAIPLGGDF